MILTDEGINQFSHALELLNSSIREFAEVADRMVPEKLLTEGLGKYLNEFCVMLEEEYKIATSYNFEGNQDRADKETEILMFRCFRNLILLILKYGDPANINLHMYKTVKKLSIIISDDGKKDLFREPHQGIKTALENLLLTLKQNNGNLHFNESQTGNSTELEIPLK